MKKGFFKIGDLVWLAVLAVAVGLMVSPFTSKIYIELNKTYPYILGFIKFFVLASMGELLANRIATREWKKTTGFFYKAVLWGFYGMLITLAFKVFATGVQASMDAGYLPGAGVTFLFALFASTCMNVMFAPGMMAMHKFTDTFVDIAVTKSLKEAKVGTVLKTVDWAAFIDFIVLKTIPFFWIPMHTITFLLAPELRVAMAALLSVAFGILTATAKIKAMKKAELKAARSKKK